MSSDIPERILKLLTVLFAGLRGVDKKFTPGQDARLALHLGH